MSSLNSEIKFEYYLYMLPMLKWKEWQVSCVRPSSRGKSICFVARPSCRGIFFAGFETFHYRGVMPNILFNYVALV
jgi:hypothetical protein